MIIAHDFYDNSRGAKRALRELSWKQTEITRVLVEDSRRLGLSNQQIVLCAIAFCSLVSPMPHPIANPNSPLGPPHFWVSPKKPPRCQHTCRLPETGNLGSLCGISAPTILQTRSLKTNSTATQHKVGRWHLPPLYPTPEPNPEVEKTTTRKRTKPMNRFPIAMA